MEDILRLAKRISEALADCEYYKKCAAARAALVPDEVVSAKLFGFCRQRMVISVKHANGENVTFEEEREISRVYAELMLNKDARSYLENERELLSLAAKVHGVIDSGVYLELC